MNNKNKIWLLLLFTFCIIYFVQGLELHGIEYRDDEIFYYKSTQEMLNNDNLLSPTYFGQNRFQKPILFYWLVILSYKIFGMSWFAARIVSVFFASLTICLTWLLAKDLFNRKAAWLSSLILLTIPLFFRHAKNVVPDMALNFFIVLSVYCAFKFIQNPSSRKFRFIFFIACGLGFLIKGFTAIIFPFLILIIYSLIVKKSDVLAKANFPLGIMMVLLITLPWFIYMTKIHGLDYIKYMFVNETQNRVFASTQGFSFPNMLSTFFNNIVFYANVFLSYFSPWIIFGLFAFPLAMVRIKKGEKDRSSFQFLLIWFFVIYVFFLIISFRINHYMLYLSSPFSILLSCFLLNAFTNESVMGRTMLFLKKSLILIMIMLGCIGFVFLYFFLINVHSLLIILFLVLSILFIALVQRAKDPIFPPVALSFIMLFAFMQSPMIAHTGLTAHSTLQKFANTINNDRENHVIGVGSNDIHEKEFQVYFTKNVSKVATSSEIESMKLIADFFANNSKVYCLMIENDYNKFLKHREDIAKDIIQEEYIFRKRLYIDKEFFVSIIKLDREQVYHYLMEKVLLIKKEKRV